MITDDFIHEMVIDCPDSPNDGAVVKVNYSARGWNLITDEFDDAWVHCMMPDGTLGAIEKKYLIVPVTCNLKTDKA